MSTDICSNLRVATGGYLMNIRRASDNMMQAVSQPKTLEERAETSFMSMLETVRKACACDWFTMAEYDQMSRFNGFESEPELPTGMVLLHTLRHSLGGFVATFPKNPEEEVILPTISDVMEALMSFEYVLNFEEEEEGEEEEHTQGPWKGTGTYKFISQVTVDGPELHLSEVALTSEETAAFEVMTPAQQDLFLLSRSLEDSEEEGQP